MTIRQAMPTDALKDLLKKAKVAFKSSRDKRQDLIEKALESSTAWAIVEEEARAQGEHIDGVKVETETVEGSFVNIDSPILTQRMGAEQTSVRYACQPPAWGSLF